MKFALILSAAFCSVSAWCIPRNFADVSVPIPGGLGAPTGTLVLSGTPGADQKDEFFVAYCESDANNQIIEFGCHDTKKYKLNQPIALPAGRYMVGYSGTVNYVTVVGGQTNTLNLQKISVPGGRDIDFKVFVDYTDPSMQERLLMGYWTNDANKKAIAKCHSKEKKTQAVCNAWKSGDLHALLNTMLFFRADAGYSIWTIAFYDDGGATGNLSDSGRDYVTDPKAGQFVSVLPGTYGIVFSDPLTGKTATQYGIVVK